MPIATWASILCLRKACADGLCNQRSSRGLRCVEFTAASVFAALSPGSGTVATVENQTVRRVLLRHGGRHRFFTDIPRGICDIGDPVRRL
jgi:hypothetical protein